MQENAVKASEDVNVIELLRGKTEQSDLDGCLQSSFGGYTKKSVIKYLTLLRERQQSAAETFDQNIKSLFAEKEKLKAENEKLRENIFKLETDNKSITESILVHDIESGGYKTDEVENFKGTISALESELRKTAAAKDRLEDTIIEMQRSVKDLEQRLDQSRQDIVVQKSLLLLEKEETGKLRTKLVSQIDTSQKQQDEIERLMRLVTEDQNNGLRFEISQLGAELEAKSKLIEGLNESLVLKTEEIESLASENEALRDDKQNLSKSLDNAGEQNDRLRFLNKTLGDRLKALYEKSLADIDEKSVVVTEKLAALRKLDEANAKISMIEMRLQKCEDRHEKKLLNEKMGAVENSAM